MALAFANLRSRANEPAIDHALMELIPWGRQRGKPIMLDSRVEKPIIGCAVSFRVQNDVLSRKIVSNRKMTSRGSSTLR